MLHSSASSENGGSKYLENVRIARLCTVPMFALQHLAPVLRKTVEEGAVLDLICSSGPEVDVLREIEGMRVRELEISRAPSLLADLSTLLKLIALFRKERYSIVHSTTPKAGLLAAIAGWIARVPIRLHTFTGQRWVTYSGFKRRFLKALDTLTIALNHQVFVDSPSQRTFLLSEGMADPKRVILIGEGSISGFDMVRFSPDRFSEEEHVALWQHLKLPEGVPVILFVGRVCVDKGILDLIDAVVLMTKQGLQVSCLLIGPLEPGEVDGRRLDADLLARTPNVYAPGITREPEKYFALADVFCLPSYREGFGSVVLEAAAMGVPSVGSRIYGLTDAIIDQKTGLLVPPRDVHALAGALRDILTDSVLKKRLGRAAQERARRDFNAEKVLNEIIADYQKRLNELAKS